MVAKSSVEPSQESPEKSVYHNMLRGAGWGLLLRWGNRFIGVFNLMIIARLLSPTEVGIVALAMLLAGILTQFYNIGIALLLIRKQGIDDADCNTAWTMRLVLGAILAIVMALLAPISAEYFNEPRVVDVTYIIAASFFVSSCENIGMVLVRRELDFAKDFRFGIYGRFLTFIATAALAFWLRNAWAIVLGTFIGAILQVILSYRMHPYRPRIDFSRYKEYLKFSLSIIPLNIGQYLLTKLAPWLVGGATTTEKFVAYNMSADLSGIFTNQVVGSISRGQFPNYAKILHQPQKLATAFSHELNAICSLVLPISVGLAIVAEDAVMVLLGDQWGYITPLIPWLAIQSAIGCMLTLMTGQILIATSHEKLSTSLIWIRLAILGPIVFIASRTGDVEKVAIAVLFATALALPISVVALAWSRVVSPMQILGALWRPVVAALLMGTGLHYLQVTEWDSAIIRLIFNGLVGGSIYVASLLIIWRIAGCPEGPESALIGLIKRKPLKAAKEK